MPNQIGFACHWGPERELTWSGTPFQLFTALAKRTELTDLDLTLPLPVRQALRIMGTRRTHGSWKSAWRHSASGLTLVERRLQKVVRSSDVDRVLEIGDVGVVDRPFYILQDLSYELLLEHWGADGVPHFRTLGLKSLERLRDRQQEVYSKAAGIIAMSDWLGRSLARSGVPQERIHVVHPAVNVPMRASEVVPQRRQKEIKRLLFVGRDFDTKAGDQVLQALSLIRADHGPSIRLTIAGPKVWPTTEIPEGVDFLGSVRSSRLQSLYDEHDLFVMPSRFEGFGIVFAEALSRGLPCVGRRACAMPEIIDEESGGRLIDSDDPAVLADVILGALADDHLYELCAAASAHMRRYYSWDRAAAEVLRALA